MDNIHVIKETTLTIKRKPLALVLTYLGSISLQTRIRLKKSLSIIIAMSCDSLIVILVT